MILKSYNILNQLLSIYNYISLSIILITIFSFIFFSKKEIKKSNDIKIFKKKYLDRRILFNKNC